MTPPAIRLAHAIVALLARAAPAWRAREWQLEWDAEIDWQWRRLAQAGRLTPAAQARLVARCLGAAPHVAWLWRHEWSLDLLTHDITYAVRMLLRRPAFTATAVLTLALGIGGSTAIFTLVDRLLLRPLPFAAPEQLASIWPQRVVSKKLFAELRRAPQGFDSVAAYSAWLYTLTGEGDAVRLHAAAASANLFDVLGARAAIGRTFAADEDQPGKDTVVVISDRLWRTKFGAEPSVVGRTITLSGRPVTVVGVMPAGFEFPRARTDLWRPLAIDPAQARDYGANYLTLVGRLAPGVPVTRAESAMRAFGARYGAADPTIPDDWASALPVVPLREHLVGDTRQAVLILFAAVACVLLIACANVANLLLARATSRRREMSVRAALGASRLRIVRQLLVESVVLAAAGAAAGLVLAQWAIQALRANLPPDLVGVAGVGVDLRVLAFSALTSGATGLLFGLAPALHASKVAMRAALEEGARTGTRGRRRARRVLVVAEIALAVVLVTASGLLVKSLYRVTHVDPGFDASGVMTMRVSVTRETEDELRAFHARVFDRVRSLPGVTHAGAIHLLPMTPGNWDPDVSVDGRADDPTRRPVVNWRAATAEYFQAMSIPLVRGRMFDARDDERGEPVALVNETMAARVFPGDDPLGRRVNTFFEGDNVWARVIGVVGDVRQHGLAVRQRPEMYRPLAQRPLGTISLVVRTDGDPAALAPVLRRAIAEVDRDVPVWDMQPMREVMGASVAEQQFFALLLTAFAGTALLLGAIGIFGVISYDVSQQTRDIGVRLALGADPSRVRRAVLRDGAAMTLTGLVLGLAAAAAATTLLRGFLFGVSGRDPATFVAVAGLLSAVALLSAWLPARRAAAVDPVMALRAE